MSLQPAVATLAGFLVLGQTLSARAMAGIGLVMLACAGASLRRPPGAKPVILEDQVALGGPPQSVR